MGSPKRILLLTNSEYGQASVHLAVAHTLVELYRGDVEVHLASFGPLTELVRLASEYATKQNPGALPFVFHRIKGTDMSAAWGRPELRLEEYNGLRPGFFNTPKFLRLLLRLTSPWDGPEFVAIFEAVRALILETVKPDMTAVDPAFSPAATACVHTQTKFCILAPNTIKDFSMPFQPWGQALWRYPALASGLPYPIPWYLVPLNLYFMLYIVLYIIITQPTRRLTHYVRQHTEQPAATPLTLNLLNRFPPRGVKYLVANLPELEFPNLRIPSHLVPCGPMVRPAPSVAEVDQDLAAWLARGPTVYINTGTLHQMTEWDALEIARALRELFDKANVRAEPYSDTEKEEKEAKREKSRPRVTSGGNLQVLWKLTKRGAYPAAEKGSRIHSVLEDELDSDRVRIVPWLHPEPSSILAERSIVCSVHHGGANSFLEAVNAGVPHIVLPVWIDCFDFANRAELLGIGRWANRRTLPLNSARELGPALVDVVLSKRNSQEMRRRAEELAKICGREGGGRVVAARNIMEEIVVVG
ncbi:UDP-glucoronosyl and UDP-glucosyl transferase family protein [Apiospora arundinis]